LSIGLGALAAVAIAVVIVLLVSRGSAPELAPPCLDGQERMAGIWDDAVKDRVRTAFLATTRAHKEGTLRRVSDELDRYKLRWISDRRAICEATKVRHEQSEPAFDLRMQCMNDRLVGMQALIKLFTSADTQVIDKAATAARELPSTTNCLNLTSSVAPPTQAQAAKLDQLRAEYAAAKALGAIGLYDQSAKTAQMTIDHAAGLDYPPFLVEVQHLLGITLVGASKPAEAEKALRVALELAARAKNDRMTAAIWIALISVIVTSPERYDEALALEPIAEFAIQRADNEPTLRAELHYAIGSASLAKGDTARALAAFEAALELPTGALDEVGIATLHNALGAAYLRSGNIFGAKEAFEKSLAASKATLGPQHPDLAIALSSLGGLAQAMGSWDDAIVHHTNALQILEETRGPAHEQTGMLIYSLAVSRNGKEDFKAALPDYQRSLAIFEAISPTHPFVGLSLVGIADCLEEIGRPEEAVPAGERGLALLKDTKDQVQLALARFILAKALWAANTDRPRARKLAEQAREGFKAGGLAALTGLAAVDKWFKKIDGK
jgi:serine/threonine-protein kinase